MRLLCCILALAAVAQAVQGPVDAAHTFSAPFGSNIPLWRTGAGAVITPESVVLTRNVQSQRGYLWSITPLAGTNYQFSINAKVTGEGELGGDGWAFWIIQEQPWNTPTDPLDLFGAPRKFTGLMVMSDTFDNDNTGNNPYLAAFLSNGGEEIQPGSDNNGLELGGCQVYYRNTNGPYNLRVTLQDEVLILEYEVVTNRWNKCFQVSGVKLPPGTYHLGFSAQTGGLADTHEILRLETRTILSRQAPKQEKPAAAPVESQPAEKAAPTPVATPPPVQAQAEAQKEPVKEPVAKAAAPAVDTEGLSRSLDTLLTSLQTYNRRLDALVITPSATSGGHTNMIASAVEQEEKLLNQITNAVNNLEADMAQLAKQVSAQADLAQALAKGSTDSGNLAETLRKIDDQTHELMKDSYQDRHKQRNLHRELGQELDSLKTSSRYPMSWGMLLVAACIGSTIGCVIEWQRRRKEAKDRLSL